MDFLRKDLQQSFVPKSAKRRGVLMDFLRTERLLEVTSGRICVVFSGEREEEESSRFLTIKNEFFPICGD